MADALWQRLGVNMSRAGSRRHRPGWRRRNRWRTRLHPALEGLDDEHAPAAAGTGRPWIWRLDRLNARDWRWHRKQSPGAGDVGLAAGAGEQAVVADAMEALRQNVEQEAPDEFIRAERHCAIAFGAVTAIVLVAEGHAAFVARDQPAVRDGNAMRVARMARQSE